MVADTSMQPTLEPNDRLLVTLTAVSVGDVIVFRRPDQLRTLAVKRVASTQPDGTLTVLGDNANVSSDSRHFGSLPPELVVGKVIYRYGPRRRRGSI